MVNKLILVILILSFGSVFGQQKTLPLFDFLTRTVNSLDIEYWWNETPEWPQFYFFFPNDSSKECKADDDGWMIYVQYSEDEAKEMVIIYCLLMGLTVDKFGNIPSAAIEKLIQSKHITKFAWSAENKAFYTVSYIPTAFLTAEILAYYILVTACVCDQLYSEFSQLFSPDQRSTPNDKDQAEIKRMIKERYPDDNFFESGSSESSYKNKKKI